MTPGELADVRTCISSHVREHGSGRRPPRSALRPQRWRGVDQPDAPIPDELRANAGDGAIPVDRRDRLDLRRQRFVARRGRTPDEGWIKLRSTFAKVLEGLHYRCIRG